MSFFNSKKIITLVTKKEKPSATGVAATTPHKPHIFPKIRMQGMSAMHCLSMERKIEIFGRPVTTKKFAETIWKPASGKKSIIVRMARGANRISASLPSR
ncbi:MAG: hypothetical protein LBU82_08740, partial [Treponema sp.]|nr:hypothetical protein [Treponema sp.]